MGGGNSKYKPPKTAPTVNTVQSADVFDVKTPQPKQRRASLGRDPNSNVKVHSQLSQSFSLDPSQSAVVPLSLASDEDLLAEVARRKLDIHKKITESLVLETYEFLGTIGKGASGVVTKVRHRQTHQMFAMKTIHKDSEINDLDSMLTEIDIMKRVRHRHIVCMYELYETPRSLWIILELVTGGTLHNHLLTVTDYSEGQAARHLHQMLQGIHYLHSLGIIHRDLKVENILLHQVGDTLECKIADFGLSAVCHLGENGYDLEHSVKRKGYKLCTELWGTKEYFAPELIDREYGPQVDMWSLGCVAFEMLSGEPAFNVKKFRKERHLYDAIRKGNYSMDGAGWKEVSEDAKSFVKGLLTVKPTRRLCATEGMQHKWVCSHIRESSTDTILSGFKDNYRHNFEDDRKLKKVGSRFHLVVDDKDMEKEESRDVFE